MNPGSFQNSYVGNSFLEFCAKNVISKGEKRKFRQKYQNLFLMIKILPQFRIYAKFLASDLKSRRKYSTTFRIFQVGVNLHKFLNAANRYLSIKKLGLFPNKRKSRKMEKMNAKFWSRCELSPHGCSYRARLAIFINHYRTRNGVHPVYLVRPVYIKTKKRSLN